MNPYRDTVTWLTFQSHLPDAPSSFWLLLGEVREALRQLKGTPLAAPDARRLERELAVQGIHARFSLDGLGLPLDQVRKHLTDRSTQAANHPELDAFLSQLNHGAAGPYRLTPDDIKRVHRSLHLEAREDERPGEWRLHPFGGRPWEGLPPELIGLFVEELCDWLKSAELAAPTPSTEEAYALIRLMFMELYLAWIRPFTSGHARTAGVLGARVLGGGAMAIPTVHLLAIAMHRNGREFQRQLQKAAEGKADPVPFMTFLLRALMDAVGEFQERVRDLQLRGQWRAQLLELFQEGNDAPTRRQRQVLLDLASVNEPVPQNRLDSLTPALAQLYAGVSDKTLRRDVDALVSAGVVKKEGGALRLELGNTLLFNG